VSPSARRVLRAALQLPPKARADVAGVLLRSLDAKEQHGLDETWAMEVTRRIAEVDAGRVKLVSWPRARRRLRAELRGARTKRPRHRGVRS
jgi:putative addiction module component (TIGR02574 family)